LVGSGIYVEQAKKRGYGNQVAATCTEERNWELVGLSQFV
jgi:hypothetical protein